VSLREARLQLETSQLLLGDITYISSATIPEGAIIVATPPSGTPLPRGTPVDLEISNGSPSRPKRIPLLLNLPIEQAEDSLRKYEMRLGNIASRIANDRPVGTVVAQSPGADERARPLTPIDLVLSVQETTATWQDTVLETPPSSEEPNDER
jgi:beta-lactam-binding protein with PASTA domain